MVNGCPVSIIMGWKEQPLIIAGDSYIETQNSHRKGHETLAMASKKDQDYSTLYTLMKRVSIFLSGFLPKSKCELDNFKVTMLKNF